jgi:hypothetical protein
MTLWISLPKHFMMIFCIQERICLVRLTQFYHTKGDLESALRSCSEWFSKCQVGFGYLFYISLLQLFGMSHYLLVYLFLSRLNPHSSVPVRSAQVRVLYESY